MERAEMKLRLDAIVIQQGQATHLFPSLLSCINLSEQIITSFSQLCNFAVRSLEILLFWLFRGFLHLKLILYTRRNCVK